MQCRSPPKSQNKELIKCQRKATKDVEMKIDMSAQKCKQEYGQLETMSWKVAKVAKRDYHVRCNSS